MTESQKKEVQEIINLIYTSLDALQAATIIGSWEFGIKSYEQSIWDPKKKKTWKEYYQAVLRFMRMSDSDKAKFKFGFTLILTVQNPANTHKVELIRKEYVAKGPFFHYLDSVSYDEFIKQLDILSHIVSKLDLRKFPENLNLDGSTPKLSSVN